jgi:hypothetical protein|tara:strand:- start:944 stop:1600 length:657 start_codon:yes stop_codon:yes gene_type:complete
MKIFIGHDSRYPQATEVCERSIIDHNPDLKDQIHFLDKEILKQSELYGRKDLPGESTEFSFTRFYIPMLCNYDGIAMFCDNDFLWQCDPTEMIKYLGDNDIAVVQHEDYNVTKNKMDGIENKSYPRKNWSSLIIYNCSKLQHLTKEYLDNATAAQLHELRWAKNIGSIPPKYNWLVGLYENCGCTQLKGLHFTEGGPWFDKYKNCEFSEEWWEVYNSL